MINFETIGRKLDNGLSALKPLSRAKAVGRTVKGAASTFAESYKENLAAIKAARQQSKDKADAKRLWKEWQKEEWDPKAEKAKKGQITLFDGTVIKWDN